MSATPVAPTCDGNNICTFAWDDRRFVVDGNNGARIIEFSLSGVNAILSQAAATALGASEFGSTFWPSPQNGDGGWGWPPIATIDTDPYTVTLAGDAVQMTSATFSIAAGGPEMTAEKVFSANAADGVVTISYTFHNVGTAPVSVAPWEITRVAAGGLTFFPNPTSAPVMSGCGSFTPPPVTTLDSYTFFADDAATFADASTEESKFCADGGSKGYEAHLAGSQLLVQAWQDVPASENVPRRRRRRVLHRPELDIRGGGKPRPIHRDRSGGERYVDGAMEPVEPRCDRGRERRCECVRLGLHPNQWQRHIASDRAGGGRAGVAQVDIRSK